jgi:hypothetical protein
MMPTLRLTRERWKARECPGGLGRVGCEHRAQQMLENGDDVCRGNAWQKARMFQAETLMRVPQRPRVAGLLCQRGLSVVLQ